MHLSVCFNFPGYLLYQHILDTGFLPEEFEEGPVVFPQLWHAYMGLMWKNLTALTSTMLQDSKVGGYIEDATKCWVKMTCPFTFGTHMHTRMDVVSGNSHTLIKGSPPLPPWEEMGLNDRRKSGRRS